METKKEFQFKLKPNFPPIRFEVKEKTEKLYILQIVKGRKNIVHSLVPAEDVHWPTEIIPNQRQILFDLDHRRHMATVLMSGTDLPQVRSEFEKLKVYCFEKVNNEEDYFRNYCDDAWMLVQYTCGPSNMIYTIVHRRETFDRDENEFPDVVTYISIASKMHQAIILRKSKSIDELLNILESLKETLRSKEFPLTDKTGYDTNFAIPPLGYRSIYGGSAILDDTASTKFPSEYFKSEELVEFEKNLQNTVADIIVDLMTLKCIKRSIELSKKNDTGVVIMKYKC